MPIFLAGATFLLLRRRIWLKQFPSEHRLVLIGSLLMLASMPLGLYSSVLGDRFGYYLIPIELMVWCKAPLLFGDDFKRVISASIPVVVSLLLLFVWTTNLLMFKLCYADYNMWS